MLLIIISTILLTGDEYSTERSRYSIALGWKIPVPASESVTVPRKVPDFGLFWNLGDAHGGDFLAIGCVLGNRSVHDFSVIVHDFSVVCMLQS